MQHDSNTTWTKLSKAFWVNVRKTWSSRQERFVPSSDSIFRVFYFWLEEGGGTEMSFFSLLLKKEEEGGRQRSNIRRRGKKGGGDPKGSDGMRNGFERSLFFF